MATIIFKVTEDCNSNCLYCDVVHKKHRGPTTMPLELLELLFIRIDEFLLQTPDGKLDLVWHGGEPLLLGPAYYEQALAFQQKHYANTSTCIHHSIQTNLSLFTHKFARVFRMLGITSVGTSYDPIVGVRGPGRIPHTDIYNKRFMRSLEVIEEEGFSWGVIYVVTKLTLAQPLDIFYFMTNLKPDGGVDFHPVLVYGPEPRHLAITPDEFADFLGTIFQIWWNHQDRFRSVNPFQSLLRNTQEGVCSLSCADSGACADKYWNVGPDGSVSHCGRSADWNLLNYGSIQTKTLEEIAV
jgi:sulfatase maturation enzyme AslB (radical SAM superfamily)